MPYSRAGLTPAEQQMIAKLADACHLIDEIYLHQSDLGGWSTATPRSSAKNRWCRATSFIRSGPPAL
jgi:hypothetical protein